MHVKRVRCGASSRLENSGRWQLPAATKTLLHGAIVAALNDPQIKPKLLNLGFEIVGNSPEQFTAYQATEFARWKTLIDSRKISAD
jgi:tripartite-type tricarboxylate transporter receptor subunit TctC